MIFDHSSSLENSSSRNSWFLFNSSNFWILLIRVSRSARSRAANLSWRRACTRLDCSYPVRVCAISTAWESICLFNSKTIFSARSALYSCLRISDFASASNCSFVCPKVILICQLSNSWLDLRFLWHPLTGFPVLAKNWMCTLQQAFSLWVKACSKLALFLAPEGTVVKPAISWCARRQSQHLGTSRRCR